jgi:hypothetical protein
MIWFQQSWGPSGEEWGYHLYNSISIWCQAKKEPLSYSHHILLSHSKGIEGIQSPSLKRYLDCSLDGVGSLREVNKCHLYECLTVVTYRGTEKAPFGLVH